MRDGVYSVFISYSWTSKAHEKWVHELASRLMENGVDVKLDKWDLKPGHDKYYFMESMVRDENIDRVLVICDQGYKKKADNRTGGVGTETEIITPEVYSNARQEKFIPIIAEIGDTFESFIPIYLKSAIGINMSSDEVYENGYEELLRLIYERPQFRKPARGIAPSFLFDDGKVVCKTTNINKILKNSIINKPNQVKLLINEFINELKCEFEKIKFTNEDIKEPDDEIIYNCINDMETLKNDYVKFLENIVMLKSEFNIDIIIGMFEDIFKFSENQESGTFNPIQFDHYKFFITEIFIYTVAILIKYELYDDLAILLSTKFYVDGNRDGVDFTTFRFYIQSLDNRKQRIDANRVSLTADLLIQRSSIENKSYKSEIIEADLFLYYISLIKKGESYRIWFPTTYIYIDEYKKINILRKLERSRHFEKIKCIFGINTVEELKVLIEKASEYNGRGYPDSWESIPNIKTHIDIDKIASCI